MRFLVIFAILCSVCPAFFFFILLLLDPECIKLLSCNVDCLSQQREKQQCNNIMGPKTQRFNNVNWCVGRKCDEAAKLNQKSCGGAAGAGMPWQAAGGDGVTKEKVITREHQQPGGWSLQTDSSMKPVCVCDWISRSSGLCLGFPAPSSVCLLWSEDEDWLHV